MTILSDVDIRKRLAISPEDPAHRLVIEPFCERTVFEGKSYGLSGCGYDLRIKDELFLDAGSFALAVTVEYLEFPHDVRGVLADKSSWVRRGLAVQNTRFEPGWRGYPTIELSNHSSVPIRISAGTPIGQMEFGLLSSRTSQPYSGKYQDQPQRPVGAIDEEPSG